MHHSARLSLCLAPLTLTLTLTLALSLGCGNSGGSPMTATDAGNDAKRPGDSGHTDAGHPDAERPDASHPLEDAGERDTGGHDAAAEAHDDAQGADAHIADGSASDAPFDSIGPDGGWLVAPHSALPQVIDYGGAVIVAPVFTSITFAGYDQTTAANAIVDGIGASGYWTSAVTEYGVGPATSTTPVALTELAPTSIDDPGVQTWLAGQLESAMPLLPAPTGNSVYVIGYPAATSVSLQGTPVCQHFGGYHNTLALTSGPYSGAVVTYVVVGECDFGQGTAIGLSEALSHELTAVTTNPSPFNSPAYANVDPVDDVWALLAGGGEIPDLCTPFVDSTYIPAGFPFTVERVWSDANANAGHDPCQPAATGEVYFNSAPQLNDSVTITPGGGIYQVHGVLTPLNTPKTIEVDLYSDGPTSGPWAVAADDLSSVLGGGPYLSFSWDATTGENGTKLHLTITPVAASSYGGEPFEITSTLGTTKKVWYGAVSQQ
jgi:hypothetical protein